MQTENLQWQEKSRKEVYRNRIFRIEEMVSCSPSGQEGVYSVLESQDFVLVIPVLSDREGAEAEFLTVSQWRHGTGELSLEFPGGLIDPGEAAEAAAARELQEETGYRAGRLELLGKLSPNPAIMGNWQYIFAAYDLENTGVQDLDEDEYVSATALKRKDIEASPLFTHALMYTALYLYDKRRSEE
jgi:8-oxo-dGTP pyrophosphatase MutT (NUDIX family)